VEDTLRDGLPDSRDSPQSRSTCVSRKALYDFEVLGPGRIWPDSGTYTSAIAVCGKAKEWQRALLLLEDMVKKVRHEPTPDIPLLTEEQLTFEFRNRFSNIRCRRLRLVPAVMMTLSDSSPHETLLHPKPAPMLTPVPSPSRPQGVPPMLGTYNAAMNACRLGGQADRAIAFLEEMLKKNIPADRTSLEIALSACVPGKKIDKALEVRLAMQEGAGERGGQAPVCDPSSARVVLPVVAYVD
jgi:pentatricopeptide repeat protein